MSNVEITCDNYINTISVSFCTINKFHGNICGITWQSWNSGWTMLIFPLPKCLGINLFSSSSFLLPKLFLVISLILQKIKYNCILCSFTFEQEYNFIRTLPTFSKPAFYLFLFTFFLNIVRLTQFSGLLNMKGVLDFVSLFPVAPSVLASLSPFLD